MQIPERTRYIGDEDVFDVWWLVNGALVNFSSGYTFEVKVAKTSDPATILFTKTTGFAGAVGAGTEGDTGTPNLVISWATSGELNSVTTAGRYIMQIVATKVADSSETTYQMTLNMRSRLG